MRWLIIYLGVSSAVVNPALAFAPILVGGMVTTLGFSTSAAVIITSAELAATALAFIPALWWVTRLTWQKVASLSLFAIVIGNLISVGCDSFVSLMLIRVLTGLFEGTMLIVYMVVTAQVTQTEQVFGGKLALQMLSIVAGLALFPMVIVTWGVSAVYALLALVCVVLLVTVKQLPNMKKGVLAESSLQLPSPKNGIRLARWGGLSLLSLLIFAAGTNVVWTYVERIGSANDLRIDTIGLILAVSISLAIFCGLCCVVVGLRFGRLLPISIGLLAGILGCVLLTNVSSGLAYFMVGTLFLAVAKVLPLPYLFGCLAVLDNDKSLAIFSHVVLSLGMASGPMLAVVLLPDLDYQNVLVIGITLLTLVWLMAVKLVGVVQQKERLSFVGRL